MKRLKVYLDTSVINFLYADDSPEFKQLTIDFFENYVKTKVYDISISDIVIDEINKTKDEVKRQKLLNVLNEYALTGEFINEEGERLADIYVKENVIPPKYYDDARHIGFATFNNFDILLSWNFKHLANVTRKNKVKLINEKEGYFYPLDIVSPLQLMNDENNL